jgi:hypothetical protein
MGNYITNHFICHHYIPVGFIRSKNLPRTNRFRSSADSHSSSSPQLFPIPSNVSTQLSQSLRVQSCPLRPPRLSGYIKKFSNLFSAAPDPCCPTLLPRNCTHSRGVQSANPIRAQLGACRDTCSPAGPCRGTSGPPTRSATTSSSREKCSTTSRWSTSNGWLGEKGSSSTSIASKLATTVGLLVLLGFVRSVLRWAFDVCASKSLKCTIGTTANKAVAIARLVQPFVGLTVLIPITPRSSINISSSWIDIRNPPPTLSALTHKFLSPLHSTTCLATPPCCRPVKYRQQSKIRSSFNSDPPPYQHLQSVD